MHLEKGERIVSVLPLHNTWIVCVDGPISGWHVERADFVAITSRRSGVAGERHLWFTHLALCDSGTGDSVAAYNFDGMFGIYEAPDADAAIRCAQNAISADATMAAVASGMRAAQARERQRRTPLQAEGTT